MVKRILCYGDSNTWGYIPGSLNLETGYVARFNEKERWPMLLEQLLGLDYRIIEEGLNSRTTNLDREDLPAKNGLTYLLPCLESHAPLDLVIIMLGTNDLNVLCNRTSQAVASGIESLVHCIKKMPCAPDMISPADVLLVVPPRPAHEEGFSPQFKGAIEKSKALPELYEAISMREGCYCLNAEPEPLTSEIDGIHLHKQGHERLARLVFEKVKNIFEEKI
ncbi:MAG: hypothetical protein COV52_05105 [Gammaproteobacteria bacterium CG11_big_fil_rev_8_21_14_0_20_46_22]|nr:MAG: hypothetical protein COW05_10150 [Gammaproteobacteria bacterium CG12_big_fil_rev_8_21_14_0_65_46_12]PIR11174.1 MAG: hypothetical protein COV52_05105 [Gammaproteobacteria bacterium CG11_big_fil_rev_8_21_14_0_20_46_22]